MPVSYKTEINSISINTLISQNSITNIDILKIDIEGAEKYLFSHEANLGWLDITRCIIFECPDRDAPFTTQLIFEQITSRGFKFNTFICGENIILMRQDFDCELIIK